MQRPSDATTPVQMPPCNQPRTSRQRREASHCTMPLRSANIVGSGPNGLSAAITLAQRGVAVTVFERNRELGGACATAELTLPGFHHDVGSSAYPLGVASPFFNSLPLAQYGLRWLQPEIPVAHPLDGGEAAVLYRDLDATAAQFSSHDARAWHDLLASSVRDWPALVADFLQPLLRIPSNPVALGTFGTAAIWPAKRLAEAVFQTEPARALFAGCAAHSVLPLTRIVSSATALVLAASGHAVGWPVVAGGGGAITQALAAYLRDLGGTILLDHPIRTLRDLPPADANLFDTSAQAVATICGDSLTQSFRTRLTHFKRGPGIFKIDYALDGPIPWAVEPCRRAGTVHVGGTLTEITRSEHDAFFGHIPSPSEDKPFLLLVQPSVIDPSRAPAGKHTAWAYCHVPAGSDVDRTGAIELQIERFAPGFRDTVLARRVWNPADLAASNPNLLAGDVSGGAMTLTGLVARPTLRAYRTSNPRLYLCSSSTPPGGGVHGMAGHNAALAVLGDHFDS